ncbi:LacI family transcriptional regulator [Spirochaetia bacterium]|nr:LacI family transcriptional regulator [Spirochaetia bacterium]
MITLQDIADEAGVSKMTVSNVINGNTNKCSRTKAKHINAIIEKHGYVPNSSARTLSAKSSRIITGIFAESADKNVLTDEYLARFFGEVSIHVQQRGYYFMLRRVGDYREVTASLRSWNVDGAVFVGMSNEDIKKSITDNSIPLIFTDSYTDIRNISNIGVDDYKGGGLAAECFIRNGHRNVGFVTYSIDFSDLLQRRLKGYRDFLGKNGLSLKNENIHEIWNTYTMDDLVNRHRKAGSKAPSAYFVTADKLAVALIRRFYDNDIHVPKDVSVIGFDNLAISSLYIPGISTIAQDIDQKAKIAADMLFNRIENPASPGENIVMDVSLVERESVRKIQG